MFLKYKSELLFSNVGLKFPSRFAKYGRNPGRDYTPAEKEEA